MWLSGINTHVMCGHFVVVNAYFYVIFCYGSAIWDSESVGFGSLLDVSEGEECVVALQLTRSEM